MHSDRITLPNEIAAIKGTECAVKSLKMDDAAAPDLRLLAIVPFVTLMMMMLLW